LLLGRQEEAQGRIASPESLSTELFNSGIALAANAGLLGRSGPTERYEFLADIDDALADLRLIQTGIMADMTIAGTPEMTS
jgi:glycerol-3-phosphate O-acyltransferase